MKEQILKLRAEGKSYKQIQETLGCSKATISYHCGEGQKEKLRKRTNEYRNNNPLLNKVCHFKSDLNKCMQNRVTHFHRGKERNFTYKDILKKYGNETNCYLTGQKVFFNEAESFTLDHIVPRSRGGNNTMDNLGVTIPDANQMKGDLLLNEFLNLCEMILINFGYGVTKPPENDV